MQGRTHQALKSGPPQFLTRERSDTAVWDCDRGRHMRQASQEVRRAERHPASTGRDKKGSHREKNIHINLTRNPMVLKLFEVRNTF